MQCSDSALSTLHSTLLEEPVEVPQLMTIYLYSSNIVGQPCQFILYLSQLVIILFPRRLFPDLHHRLHVCCLLCSSKWDNLVIHLNKCLLLSSDRSRLVDSNIYILCILLLRITSPLPSKIKFYKQIEKTDTILAIPFIT